MALKFSEHAGSLGSVNFAGCRRSKFICPRHLLILESFHDLENGSSSWVFSLPHWLNQGKCRWERLEKLVAQRSVSNWDVSITQRVLKLEKLSKELDDGFARLRFGVPELVKCTLKTTLFEPGVQAVDERIVHRVRSKDVVEEDLNLRVAAAEYKISGFIVAAVEILLVLDRVLCREETENWPELGAGDDTMVAASSGETKEGRMPFIEVRKRQAKAVAVLVGEVEIEI